MSSPSAPLTIVYASDEDIAVRAGTDFALLCPRWQKLAEAYDGSFTAGLGWVLNSASGAFTAAKIAPGHVVWLMGGSTTPFKGSGDLFGVDAVTATSITLHRVGLPTGTGQPPGPAAGVSGLHYTVLTFGPQIEAASFWLNQQYRISPGWPGRGPTDLFDLRDLRDACVLTVIVRRLVAEVQDTRQGNWLAKLENYRMDLELVSGRLQLRWTEDERRPNSNWFSTRLVR